MADALLAGLIGLKGESRTGIDRFEMTFSNDISDGMSTFWPLVRSTYF